MAERRDSVPSGRSRLRGAAVPAALVGVSVLLVMVVVLASSLMGNDDGARIPIAGASPAGASPDGADPAGADQGQVLDGQTQVGSDATPRAFRPLSVEAENGTLSPASGRPSPYPCGGCSGGSKVRFVGRGRTVTFGGVSVPASATYHLTVAYELDGARSFFVGANGGPSTEVRCTGSNWSRPATVTVAIVLRAGINSITFGNPGQDAPDLDGITIGP